MTNNVVNRIAISTCLSLPVIALTAFSALADTMNISVINNSGKTMTAVYFSPPEEDNWGENALEGSIDDRQKQDFEWEAINYGGPENDCVFDVRAEYEDGKYTDLMGVDLCKESSLNFN
ncbi:MAG: hypothetical protein ACKPEN_19495 [Planktothrix sp.]|uniref:hypothetical protein n=1 Tax=Planktothrix sp. TaxID=3088171 RepID=UPI0038D4084A